MLDNIVDILVDIVGPSHFNRNQCELIRQTGLPKPSRSYQKALLGRLGREKMHIAVILRIVPDLSEDLDIADSGTDIDREWVGLKLNEFDDHALEEAVLIKEASGARVTAIALAGDGAERQLQTAIARGADDALADRT